MALIPAGELLMGSEDGDGDESPVHKLYLDTYYIDVYEVTNARYSECVSSGLCDPPKFSSSIDREDYYGNTAYDNYPVVWVSWLKARDYCKWRSARLPTEPEWEKAARGGLEGKQFPWGDEDPVCQKGARNGAKFDDNDLCDHTGTEPVGSYSPNGYGLYDMSGNVWEWTSSLLKAYPYHADDGREGLSVSGGRVLRGGSWLNSVVKLRVAGRLRYVHFWDGSIGFRCARSP